ncbi:hypothetical protein ACU4HD_02815 [Cupriavidus basilensis]
MSTPAKISTLLLIADKAIELHGFESDVRDARRTLDEAYSAKKKALGLSDGRYERDTPEWDAVMNATATEYRGLELAKNGARKAKRRLDTAVKAYLRGGEK